MRNLLVWACVALGFTNFVLATPLPVASRPLGKPDLVARGDLPKPSTIHALVFGGVISGLSLTLTRQVWVNWNVAHMDPSTRPLPIDLNPSPPQAILDEKAVTNALKRIIDASEHQIGKPVGEIELRPEDAAVINGLTPEQKKQLAHVLLASASASGPGTVVQHDRRSSQLQRRLTWKQALASGIFSGAFFAIGGLLVQEFINRNFGPPSSYQKRTENQPAVSMEELD